MCKSKTYNTCNTFEQWEKNSFFSKSKQQCHCLVMQTNAIETVSYSVGDPHIFNNIMYHNSYVFSIAIFLVCKVCPSLE